MAAGMGGDEAVREAGGCLGLDPTALGAGLCGCGPGQRGAGREHAEKDGDRAKVVGD